MERRASTARCGRRIEDVALGVWTEWMGGSVDSNRAAALAVAAALAKDCVVHALALENGWCLHKALPEEATEEGRKRKGEGEGEGEGEEKEKERENENEKKRRR